MVEVYPELVVLFCFFNVLFNYNYGWTSNFGYDFNKIANVLCN